MPVGIAGFQADHAGYDGGFGSAVPILVGAAVAVLPAPETLVRAPPGRGGGHHFRVNRTKPPCQM